jgi:hypothetical protein
MPQLEAATLSFHVPFFRASTEHEMRVGKSGRCEMMTPLAAHALRVLPSVIGGQAGRKFVASPPQFQAGAF